MCGRLGAKQLWELSVCLLFFRFGAGEEYSELFGYPGFIVWKEPSFYDGNNVIHTKGDV